MEHKKNQLEEALMEGLFLAKYNPCRMATFKMNMIGMVIKYLVAFAFSDKLTSDRVASYYGITTRTLKRWQKKYPDFPKPRHNGKKCVSYNAVEVARWGIEHAIMMVR